MPHVDMIAAVEQMREDFALGAVDVRGPDGLRGLDGPVGPRGVPGDLWVEPEPAPDAWDEPKLLDHQIVEPPEGDFFRVELKRFEGFVEILQVDIAAGWEEQNITVDIAEAIRLHRALGKVLENGQENI